MSETIENNKIKFEIINTGIDGAEGDDVLKITHRALTKISSLLEEKKVPKDFYLRIALKGGGTEGMEYFLEFDSLINENDKTYEVKDINIIIDNKTLFYLIGITIDYKEDDEEDFKGFYFTLREIEE